MNSLKEILTEIKAKKEIIATESAIKEIQDPPTYRSKMGVINRAKLDLEELKEEYRTLIKQKAAFILVTGKNTDKFANLASSEYGCFGVEADGFYEKLIEELPESLYMNCSLPLEVFGQVNYKFQEIAGDLDIVSYMPMAYAQKHKRIIKSKDMLLDIIKDAFNEFTGSEVVGLYAINQITPKAIETEYDNPVVPIVLSSKDEKLIKDLASNLTKLSHHVFVVAAGDVSDEKLANRATVNVKSATKKQVEEGLVTIRNLLV